MCVCRPEVRTPFCGRSGCEWPPPYKIQAPKPNEPAPRERGYRGRITFDEHGNKTDEFETDANARWVRGRVREDPPRGRSSTWSSVEPRRCAPHGQTDTREKAAMNTDGICALRDRMWRDGTAAAAWFRDASGHGTSAYSISPRSPWPSEICALAWIGKLHDVDLWAESGTYHGQAMATLLRCFPRAEGVTVEYDVETSSRARERLWHEFGEGRVRVLCGDGNIALPSSIVDLTSRRIGVFIDGPKALPAVDLAMRVLSFPHVKFVGIHDTYAPTSGVPVPARAALENLGMFSPNLIWWATDDSEWVAATKHLDAGLYEAHQSESSRSGWRPYEKFAAGQPTFKMPGYGPTITFLVKVRP